MKNAKFTVTMLILLLALLFLHVYGMSQHLYLNYWFYDLITHFLGGACIALSAIYILGSSKYAKHIIIIAFVAGIVWEIFEVCFDITGWPVSSRAYQLDTVKDLIMDTLGAFAAWFIVSFKK